MPEIGDIKQGKELGKKSNCKNVYHACEACGTIRWVELRGNKPKSKICLKCQSTSAREKANQGDKGGVNNPSYKHGGSKTRLYITWIGMRDRCFNQKAGNYKHYGAKGIKVCDEWNDFATFREWALVNGYNDSLVIDRINANGHYEPDNCEWVTKRENANRRNNDYISTDKAIQFMNLVFIMTLGTLYGGDLC